MNWCGGGVSWWLVECVAGVCANDAVPHHRPARRPPYHPVANGRGAAHEGCAGTWDGPESVGRWVPGERFIVSARRECCAYVEGLWGLYSFMMLWYRVMYRESLVQNLVQLPVQYSSHTSAHDSG